MTRKVPLRWPLCLLGVLSAVPTTATTAAESGNPTAQSVDPYCVLINDSMIPRIITDLQRMSELLPSVPPAEAKAQADRHMSYFQGGDIPPAQRPPGTEAGLHQLARDMDQWRYVYLARLLNSLSSAQAAVGYVLLDPKASREYEQAGHLVASPGGRGGKYENPEAEKLFRATFAAKYLATLDADLKAFLATEQLHLNDSLISETQRNQLKAYEVGTGNAGVVDDYIRCKLAAVVATTGAPGRQAP
jgi:hypothetical protein